MIFFNKTSLYGKVEKRKIITGKTDHYEFRVAGVKCQVWGSQMDKLKKEVNLKDDFYFTGRLRQYASKEGICSYMVPTSWKPLDGSSGKEVPRASFILTARAKEIKKIVSQKTTAVMCFYHQKPFHVYKEVKDNLVIYINAVLRNIDESKIIPGEMISAYGHFNIVDIEDAFGHRVHIMRPIIEKLKT